MTDRRLGWLLCTAVFGLAGCGRDAEVAPPNSAASATGAKASVVVLDTRERRLTQPVIDAFRAASTTRVQLATGEAGSPQVEADLIILGSLAELWAVAEEDGFRPVFSAAIDDAIPAALRDEEARWTALTLRYRAVFYNPLRLTAGEVQSLQRYSDLGEPGWSGRLCLSSSQVPGNRVLIAFLIKTLGTRDAEIVVRKMRANLAATPFNDDATLVQAIADGHCAIGIASSELLQDFAIDAPAAALAMRLFDAPGAVAVDISGAGVARHAHNPNEATELLEWLSGGAANGAFAGSTGEFPANPEAAAAGMPAVAAAAPAYPLAELGFLLPEAARLIERARYP